MLQKELWEAGHGRGETSEGGASTLKFKYVTTCVAQRQSRCKSNSTDKLSYFSREERGKKVQTLLIGRMHFGRMAAYGRAELGSKNDTLSSSHLSSSKLWISSKNNEKAVTPGAKAEAPGIQVPPRHVVSCETPANAVANMPSDGMMCAVDLSRPCDEENTKTLETQGRPARTWSQAGSKLTTTLPIGPRTAALRQVPASRPSHALLVTACVVIIQKFPEVRFFGQSFGRITKPAADQSAFQHLLRDAGLHLQQLGEMPARFMHAVFVGT
ncbi:hypothetical protein B0H14DRAFT_2576823 [Mycena olivaceomarginata]|nr:hypothetical protein B0H14DRAFT_2576823 [Mycena olivaceomarginata]